MSHASAAESKQSSMQEVADKPRDMPEKGIPNASNTEHSVSTAKQENESARDIHGFQWVICVLAIFSSVFLYALDNTIVATIQPAIVQDLGHLDKLPWVSVAYQLSSVASDLTWGKLYGKFNGKALFLASIFIFEVGSAICGAAPTMDSEIVGRAICGVGGIGIYMGALNLLAVTISNAERPVYISLMGICWGSGTVLGPIIGGAFTDSSATWRWSFYINLVIGGVVAPIYLLLLPSTNAQIRETGFFRRLRSIDWVGTVIISGATVSGVMGINFGGVLFPWNSGTIIGCFICSGILWILFGIQQVYCIFTTVDDRIFPCDIVLNWEANMLFTHTAGGLGSSVVAIYFIPLYFQFVQHERTLESGVRLLPMMFLMIFASILTGTFLGRGSWFMPFSLAGGVLVLVGAVLMYTQVGIDTNPSPIYGFSVLIGFGAGLYTQGPISVVQSLFPTDRIADATAFIGFGQVLGIAIMLAVANAIFLNIATGDIEQLLPGSPPAEIQSAIQGVSSDLLDSQDEQVLRQINQVVVNSINKAYILIIIAAALTILLAPFTKRHNHD